MKQAWKRHRVTLGLVLVAALLGGVAFWDRNRISTDEAKARTLQLFDAWRPDELDSLVVEGPRGRVEVTQLPEANGEHGFALKEGDQVRSADEQEVEDFMLSLEYAGFERRVDGLDRKGLGLEPPFLLVTIAMGKLHYTLRVGGEAPSPKGARYAEVEGGARPKARYVLKAEFVRALLDEPWGLQSKQLSPYVSSDVASYEFAGAAVWALRRAGSGGRATIDLTIESSSTGKKRASFRTVDAWTTSLARLEVRSFIDDPGANKGTATLTIVPKDPKKPRAVLEFGGACEGGVVVRRSEPDVIAACVDAHVAESLRVEPARFIDSYVIGLPETDVTELKWWDEATTVELARRDEGWHMRKPEDAQLDAGVGNALLERIARAEGVPVTDEERKDEKTLGLDVPRAHLRLVGLPDRAAGPEAPEHVEELDVGASSGGIVYVRRRSDGTILGVPIELSSALLPTPSALRPTQLLDLPLKHVRALELDCGSRRQRLTRDSKSLWTRTEPATDLRADLAAANELAEALRTLTVVRWDAEKSEERHGLEHPWCTSRLVVAVPDANGNTAPDDPNEKRETIEISIGNETEGGYFARRNKDHAVFVVPRPLATMSREWLLDRGALLIEPSDVDAITVTVGERMLNVIRRGDTWALLGGTHPNDTRANVVGKALEALLAEGVVTLGPPAKAEGFDEPRGRITIRRRMGAEPQALVVGATSIWHDIKVAYVRKKGIDATFVVALARLDPLLDAP